MHRSPGRSRHKPFQPSAQGRPGCSGCPVSPLCIVAQSAFGMAADGSQPAPGLPCALFHLRAGDEAKLGRNAPRECEGVSAMNNGLVPRTQRSATLAMRSIVQLGGALQSRGPCIGGLRGLLGPGSAQQRKNAAARPGHERDACCLPHSVIASAAKQSRVVRSGSLDCFAALAMTVLMQLRTPSPQTSSWLSPGRH